MGRLIVQVQTTLDGYMCGPEGEQDWIQSDWSPDVGEYVTAIMAPAETILLGRHLAEGFIPFWAGHPEMDGAEFFNSTPKVVFSNTLGQSPWAGTTILAGDFADSVASLKSSSTGDVIAYGGARLVAGLVTAGLVDDLHLFVNPVAIGKGRPVFGEPETYARFSPHTVTAFDCGITAMQLRPAESASST